MTGSDGNKWLNKRFIYLLFLIILIIINDVGSVINGYYFFLEGLLKSHIPGTNITSKLTSTNNNIIIPININVYLNIDLLSPDSPIIVEKKILILTALVRQ